MQVKELIALFVLLAFTGLMYYPFFFGFIGDVEFHAVLLFQVAPLVIMVLFFGSIADEVFYD